MDALDKELAEAARRQVDACAGLQEACRNSIFTDKAVSLALKIDASEGHEHKRLQIEAAFREIYRLTKNGTLG
ncbi:hypothetical protein [Methylobacterium sp. B1]|uniref:hypothetical protein n=1 Tax=Methylobacterium sp. B1 TaxID=91459 RepID=UPI000344A35C|nr:hypothetical protein [Methylobacterium sp. B1]